MKAYTTISAIASMALLVQANTDFVTLYAPGAAWIQEVDATVILPQLPNPVSGDSAVWSAISTDNEASFMQGVSAVGPGEYVFRFDVLSISSQFAYLCPLQHLLRRCRYHCLV